MTGLGGFPPVYRPSRGSAAPTAAAIGSVYDDGPVAAAKVCAICDRPIRGGDVHTDDAGEDIHGECCHREGPCSRVDDRMEDL